MKKPPEGGSFLLADSAPRQTAEQWGRSVLAAVS
jgi:hypothetical protein